MDIKEKLYEIMKEMIKELLSEPTASEPAEPEPAEPEPAEIEPTEIETYQSTTMYDDRTGESVTETKSKRKIIKVDPFTGEYIEEGRD